MTKRAYERLVDKKSHTGIQNLREKREKMKKAFELDQASWDASAFFKTYREEARLLKERMADFDMIRAQILHIQNIVAEALRKRVTQDEELSDLVYNDIDDFVAPLSAFSSKKHLLETRSLNPGKRKIVRKHAQRMRDLEMPEVWLEKNRKALEVYTSLPPSRHLVNFTEWGRHFFSQDKLPLTNLFEADTRYVSGSAALQVVSDCLAGAYYLGQHGLGLQDIKLENLGFVIEGGKVVGKLFDLEGLYPLDETIAARIDTPKYSDPEAHIIFYQSEMVYQFGLCLEKVLEKWAFAFQPSNSITNELRELAREMTIVRHGNTDPQQFAETRISLYEAERRLNYLLSQGP